MRVTYGFQLDFSHINLCTNQTKEQWLEDDPQVGKDNAHFGLEIKQKHLRTNNQNYMTVQMYDRQYIITCNLQDAEFKIVNCKK